MRDDESPLDCYATALRKASRRVTQLYEEALAGTGFTATQFAILAELSTRGNTPPSVAELARALVLERSALGHTLRPLERDGLVALEASPEDARRKQVKLTAQGRARLRKAIPLWRTAQARFAERLGEEEAASLRGTLLGLATDAALTDDEA